MLTSRFSDGGSAADKDASRAGYLSPAGGEAAFNQQTRLMFRTSVKNTCTNVTGAFQEEEKVGLTVKCPSWWSGKWMKRYSVATSCMMESPRNSILWLWPLDKEAEPDVRAESKESRSGAAASAAAQTP